MLNKVVQKFYPHMIFAYVVLKVSSTTYTVWQMMAIFVVIAMVAWDKVLEDETHELGDLLS